MALLTIGMGLTSCDEQLDNAVVPGDNPETKEITLKDALVDKAVLKVSYKFNGSDCVFAYQYDAAKKAFVALDEGSDIPDEIYNNFEVTIAFDGSDKITQTVVDKSDNTKQYLLLNLYTAGSYDRIFRLSCEMKSLKVNDTEVLDKTNESVTPVSGFSVRPLADAINVGETGIFEALFTPSYATNQVVKFSSSNPSVITIDQTGKFTPVAAGTATLKAELLDGSGKIAEHTMTVNPATVLVTSVALDKTSLALTVGDAAVQLTATVAPDNASEKSVTWTSDKTSVATVDETGKVTAVAAGTATITAFANDESGKSATCTVTVTEVLATVTTAPTATASVTAGSTTALVTAGVADGGTMMYAVTTTNTKPTTTDGFSATVPTAQSLAAGTCYVWYYVKGDATHADSEIAGPVQVTIASAIISTKDVSETFTPTAHTVTKTYFKVSGFKFLYGWRVGYNGNTITISSPDGLNLSQVVFTVNNQPNMSGRNKSHLQVDHGTLTVTGTSQGSTITISGINSPSVTLSAPSATNTNEMWTISQAVVNGKGDASK